MLLKKCAILLVSLSLVSCGIGPKLTICILDEPNRFVCVPSEKEKPEFFLETKDAINYMALSPMDAEQLFSWIKIHCSKP